MKKNKYLLLMIAPFLLTYCQPAKKETPQTRLTHVEDVANDIFVGTGGWMIATDTYIIGLDYGFDEFFYRYNYRTGNPDSVYRFGNKGQGPNDFLHPFSLQYISDTLMGTYDAMLKSFTEVSLSPDSKKIKSQSLRLDNNMSFKVLKTPYNQYLGMGSYQEGMFLLFDSLGKTVQSFFEFPFKDATEKAIKNQLRGMAYQGEIAINPSGTKFAYATLNADIIHFYNILENDIQIIKKIEKRFCEYIPQEIDGGIMSAIKATSETGYLDVYATENHVFMLYSGRTFKEYEEKSFEGDLLMIYDWSGNLKKEILLDIPCKNICITPDEEILWAIAEIPEPTIVRFDLTGLRLN
ncbi:MAG: TolB-like 6-bladed beta-propeller domain-containing protein [Tannerella sp.]|jgi:hypothetical protein|nr:TolB-like 6-bladed beta-propeller domain-containing protein [Tannerella sp.]